MLQPVQMISLFKWQINPLFIHTISTLASLWLIHICCRTSDMPDVLSRRKQKPSPTDQDLPWSQHNDPIKISASEQMLSQLMCGLRSPRHTLTVSSNKPFKFCLNCAGESGINKPVVYHPVTQFRICVVRNKEVIYKKNSSALITHTEVTCTPPCHTMHTFRTTQTSCCMKRQSGRRLRPDSKTQRAVRLNHVEPCWEVRLAGNALMAASSLIVRPQISDL